VEVKLKDGLENPGGTSAKIELKGYRTQNVLLDKGWSAGYLILDALICIPTLGLGCYLIYFNGKTHEDEYHFMLLEKPKEIKTPSPKPAGPEPVPATS
jgi:hypothetical protein